MSRRTWYQSNTGISTCEIQCGNKNWEDLLTSHGTMITDANSINHGVPCNADTPMPPNRVLTHVWVLTGVWSKSALIQVYRWSDYNAMKVMLMVAGIQNVRPSSTRYQLNSELKMKMLHVRCEVRHQPVQEELMPVLYPGLQRHWYDPAVLLHCSVESQRYVLKAHSSTSTKVKQDVRQLNICQE